MTDGSRYLGADRLWHLDSPLWLVADGRSSWILNTGADVNQDKKLGLEEAMYILLKISGLRAD